MMKKIRVKMGLSNSTGLLKLLDRTPEAAMAALASSHPYA
jgi:hypothetical protein